MDQILTVLLTTEMFVGGCLAFILDNTVPGMGQPWEGHTGLGWAHLPSNRWPLNLKCGQDPCNAGPERKSRDTWAGGVPTGWRERPLAGERHGRALQVLKRVGLGEPFPGPVSYFLSIS